MINSMLQKIGFKFLDKGSVAPDFDIKDQTGQSHKLSDYKGKWVVLYFYPKDFTFGCTQEACSFRDDFEEFKKLNSVVLGVSCDTEASHKDFATKHQLSFPLLADTDKKLALSYGTLNPMGVSNRVTFIIDPEGIVRDTLSWVNWFSYGTQVLKRLKELQAA